MALAPRTAVVIQKLTASDRGDQRLGRELREIARPGFVASVPSVTFSILIRQILRRGAS